MDLVTIDKRVLREYKKSIRYIAIMTLKRVVEYIMNSGIVE
jgi:hypothetical protein